MRSKNRARTSQPMLVASGKIGFAKAARPYPIAASSLRRPSQSDSAPAKIFVIIAVASARPSINPTVSTDAPRAATR